MWSGLCKRLSPFNPYGVIVEDVQLNDFHDFSFDQDKTVDNQPTRRSIQEDQMRLVQGSRVASHQHDFGSNLDVASGHYADYSRPSNRNL